MTTTTQHTQGPVEAVPGMEYQFIHDSDKKLIANLLLNRPIGERKANCNLICEAFNVDHETGLTPRQLLAQRDELLAALIRWQNEWVVDGTPAEKANNYAIEQQINAAITKANGPAAGAEPGR